MEKKKNTTLSKQFLKSNSKIIETGVWKYQLVTIVLEKSNRKYYLPNNNFHLSNYLSV